MDSDRWSQCKQIFESALNLPRAERDRFVREACGQDHELLNETLSLLEWAERSENFLSSAAVEYVSPLPSSLLQEGELLAGRYRIAKIIGKGGMGEVYQAEDLELHAGVAIKVVLPEIAERPEVIERFRREVHLARKVTHPNVCRIFDLGYHVVGPGKKITFLTMELLPGESLASRIARAGPMTPAEALPLVRQMAAALAAAHQAGVVHRDFKSANVMLTPDAKITDFGIARSLSADDAILKTVTSTGAVCGTPAYMAPEQLQGREVTPATDIYALGLVIFEMVTGTLPFTGDTPWLVLFKRLHERPVFPRERARKLGSRWEAVIMKCLERDPAARFAGATEVADALAGDAPIPRRRKWPMLVASLLALLLATAAGVYYLRQAPRNEPAPAQNLESGWRETAFPADLPLSRTNVAAASFDPVGILFFGPSFLRTWEPGANTLTSSPIAFSAAARADCSPGLWLIHDDQRRLTRWDTSKQQPLETVALPWPVRFAACLDEHAARWGFLADAPGNSSRWIEFDAKNNRVLHSTALDRWYTGAAVDPRRRWVALLYKDGFSVRDLDRLGEIFHDTTREALVSAHSAWSESGRYLALGFKLLAVYDVAQKKLVHSYTSTGWIQDIGWIHDDGISVIDDRGQLYWTRNFRQDWQLKHTPPSAGVYQAFWVRSSNRWVAVSSTGRGVVWEYTTPSLAFDLAAAPLEIWSIAADPKLPRIAVSGKDTLIQIVDLPERKVSRRLQGHTDGIPFVHFEPGNRLISASDDKTIRLWDTVSGNVLETATGHTSLINHFAVSPGDQWLVSVSSDDKIKLWQLPDLKFVADLGTTSNAGAAVSFLGNDQRLAISDWHGAISEYQGTPPDWKRTQQVQIGKNVVYMLCPGADAWWATVPEGDSAGLWRIPAADFSHPVHVQRAIATYCSSSADGRFTAVMYPNHVELRSNTDGAVAAYYDFPEADGDAVAVTGTPPMVIAGFSSGHLLAWPLKF